MNHRILLSVTTVVYALSKGYFFGCHSFMHCPKDLSCLESSLLPSTKAPLQCMEKSSRHCMELYSTYFCMGS